MAAQQNIGGALCESSVIPFLVARCKVWLTPASGMLCSNAANWRTQDLAKWIFHLSKIPSGGKRPRKCI